MRKLTRSSPLESSLLRAAARHLKALARRNPSLCWRKRHGTAFSVSGDPDLYGSWRGTHFEIELKRPGEEPTPLQQHRIAEWGRAGAHCFVVHTLAELQKSLDTLRSVVAVEKRSPPR